MVDEVAKEDEWELKTIDDFSGGLNTNKRENAISDNQLVALSNIITQKDQVRVDTGYTTFGPSVRGYPQAIIQFRKTTGTITLCLITTATFYIWSTSKEEWQYISDGTSTTADGGEPAGETSINVADITGFSNGDYIGLALSDGTQHQTTINGSPSGTTIVITDGIPSGVTLANGAVIVKAKDLSGDADHQVDYVTIANSDWLVFTNGVDIVQRYDGATVEDVPNLPSSGNVVCKALAYFNGHLILLNTVEGGTAYPQRARRSDTYDPTEWTTGNAGYNDLDANSYSIQAAAPLGPYVIIYKDKSIVRTEYVGTTDKLFDFVDTIQGDSAVSTQAIVVFKDYHVLVGSSNVYKYQGGLTYEELGDNIYRGVFGQAGDLNPTYKGRTVAFYVQELDEVWILYPNGSNAVPVKVLRYNLQNRSWWVRDLADDILGYGTYKVTSTRTWNDLTGTWAEQNWTWNSVSVLANAATILLCGYTDKQVFEYNYTAGDDDGTDIAYSMTTKDFYHKHYYIRVNVLEMLVAGSSITVEYSIDKGETWSTYGTASPGVSLAHTKIWKQIVGRRVRFRISGSGSGFKLDWLSFEFVVESEW